MPRLAKSVAEKRAQAYRNLGVDPNRVMLEPKITPHLRKLPGGLKFAIECLMASDSQEARAFVVHYYEWGLSQQDRDLLPIEAFCIAIGVSPWRLLGVITETAGRLGANLGAVLAAMAHPDIVQTSIEQAKLPGGITDREMQLKHMQFLPLPKGSQVNV